MPEPIVFSGSPLDRVEAKRRDETWLAAQRAADATRWLPVWRGSPLVKLGPARGDQIAVLSGIRPGDEVVTSGVFKLRNGAAVQVNNDVQPANSAAPKPEDS